jgi:hypothetical protein
MAETTGPVGAEYEQPTPADETAALEAQIEATRREMAETIDAIQERLDPDRLRFEAEQRVEQAVGRAKDEVYDATIGRVEDATTRATRTVTDWRDNVIETIKENPFPAALVGIGLGWLLMEGSSSSDRRSSRNRSRYQRDYNDRYADRRGYLSSDARSRYRGYDQDNGGLSGAGSRYGGGTQQRYYSTGDDSWRDRQGTLERTAERVEETWDDVTSGVRGRIDQLREDAGQLEDEARSKLDSLINDLEQMVDDAEMNARQLRFKAESQARRARTGVENLMDENPLALGAVALALGAAVGLAMPRTEVEDELMGDYRDRVVERAQETAERAREQVEQVAGEATDAAREAFQNVKQEAKDSAQQVKRTAQEEMDKAGTTSGNLRDTARGATDETGNLRNR